MNRNIFEPDEEYYEQELADDEYLQPEVFAYQEEEWYGDEMPAVESPEPAFIFAPGFAQGPSSRQIVVITTGLCLLLMFGLLAIASKTVMAVSGASSAAQEVRAQETVLAVQPAPTQTAAAQDGECSVSELFPAKVRKWCVIITKYANKHNLDPNLVAAVIWLESGGSETAFSRSGAVGLMQVMPSDGPSASFMCANGPCFSDRPTIQQLNDPEFNVSYGTRMLAGLVRRTGDVREALRSYGPMDAGYSYADKVLGLFQRYGK